MLRRALFIVPLLAALGAPARAQTLAEITRTPDSTADAFLRSVRAIRWGVTARLLHPETLERFHTLVTMIAEADSTGEAGRYLTGTEPGGIPSLSGMDVFERAIGAMIDDMPGLMNALYDRDDEVLGHVPEGTDSAHVVYRTLARIGGAVPEVKVMQLERVAEGWRIRWTDELAVLDAALRGVRMGRR